MTVPVAIDGAGLAGLPLRADAGADQTVEQGAKVTLDGGGSSGDIDSMSWSAPAGVTLTGANTATPTFTAPNTAGKLTFTLTVTGNGKTQTDSVDVTVKAATRPRPALPRSARRCCRTFRSRSTPRPRSARRSSSGRRSAARRSR